MSYNLAERPKEERQAIEIDKAQSFIAHQWLRKFQPYEIRQKLEDIESPEEREDMRRRLNEMRTHPRYARRKTTNGQPQKSPRFTRTGRARRVL